jgi:prolipoprotein diacylglyceryltransferase
MNSIFSAITWDLDPIIFELGKLQIRYYGLLWGIGIYAGYQLTRKLFENEKEDIMNIHDNSKQRRAVFISRL